MGREGIYFSLCCPCTNPRKGLAQIFGLQRLQPASPKRAVPLFSLQEQFCLSQFMMKGGNHLPSLPNCSPNKSLPFCLPKEAHICRAAFAVLTASIPTLLPAKGMGKGSGDGAQKCADGNVAGEGVGDFDLQFICSAFHL